MCGPIAMASVMAIGKAAEISATNKAATAAQNSAVERQNILNNQSMEEMRDISRKTAMDLTTESRKALSQRSTARAMSAESGVAGVVNLRNFGNVIMQSSFTKGTITSLGESEVLKVARSSEGDYLETVNAVNIAENKKSSGLSAALQIGVAGAQGYGMGGGFSGGTAASGVQGTAGYNPGTSNWQYSKDTFNSNFGFK